MSEVERLFMFKIYFSLCNIYVFLWTDLYLFSIFLFWGFFSLVNCRHLEQAASRLTPGDPHLVIFTSLCNPLSCLTRVGLREPLQYGRSDTAGVIVCHFKISCGSCCDSLLVVYSFEFLILAETSCPLSQLLMEEARVEELRPPAGSQWGTWVSWQESHEWP